MKNNINFSNEGIVFLFTKVNKKYNVELNYTFPNEYQLLNNSIKIYTDSNSEISSIDIRKLNIYSLNKKALKQITNYCDIDPKNFAQKSGNKNFNKFNIKKINKKIKNRTTKDRDELMSLYAYTYNYYINANYNNYSLYLAKKLNYSENYIKNLSKELFISKYLLKIRLSRPQWLSLGILELVRPLALFLNGERSALLSCRLEEFLLP